MPVPKPKTLGVTGKHRAGGLIERRYEGRRIGSGAGDRTADDRGKGSVHQVPRRRDCASGEISRERIEKMMYLLAVSSLSLVEKNPSL